MDKDNMPNKTITIILLLVLIAIGGLVLYGEKNPNWQDKKPPSIKSLIQHNR